MFCLKHIKEYLIRFLRLGVLVCIFFISPTEALSSDYFVSKTGSDSNNGSQSSPWATVQKAANTVIAGDTVNVADGIQETTRVTINKSGTEQAPIIFKASGGSNAATTKGFTLGSNFPISYVTLRDFRIINAIGKGIEVMCKGCVIENNYIEFSSDGGILIKSLATNVNGTVIVDNTSSSQIIIKNNRLYRNAQFGIDVRGRNNLIEGNEVWDTIQHHPNRVPSPNWADADGIHFHGSGHVFKNNYIHDIKFDGKYVINSHTDCFQTFQSSPLPYQEAASNIIFDGNRCFIPDYNSGIAATNAFMLAKASNLIIKNNVIHAYGGINTGGGENSNLIITNNTWIGLTNQTVLKNCQVGIECWPSGINLKNTPNVTIKNNIFYDHLYAPVIVDATSNNSLVHSNNLMYRTDGKNWNADGLISSTGELWKINPKFINPSSVDYRLQNSSPAIDSGTNTGVSTDKDGITRPQGQGYDIGAYEYIGETQPTSTSIPPTPTPIPPTLSPIPTPIPGDITGPTGFSDNKVDMYDYNQLVSDFGKRGNPGFIKSDIVLNGRVNIFDFNVIITNFGKTQ
ncbi:MAG: hypothetical protein UR68_C0028G0015 [Candidatus Roizmanbacteria bacterium GW2011_GWA2_35_19]|uniref:Right handed beta helix domain-containing protein n=2 Tax=Candidatus Roizmaniibacteriota TaxID=1752723 RepID=A0A0G0BQN6_9BACT|nr:MAG: hypothetical protein UR63_C0010G0013 [Candidatus Roizmanbacteria bacterium GW2011_GWC2_35_12]KKP71698.1 MAG: hypothetical protein UR68_C0028G0015 [Candidatus Roizmanbacteria bacterium GW2011_GWA2_35_19]